MQSTDPDGLSALYANGGSLMNETQDEVRFDENEGFKAYLTDQVERYNNKLMGDGVATNMFGSGNTVMFPEGPWWVSQVYNSAYNNSELRRVGKGVTEEDAQNLLAKVEEKFADVDVSVVYGGQPVYYYIISVE